MRKTIWVIPVLFVSLFILGSVMLTVEPASAASSNLSQGSRGTEVVTVQKALNNDGYWCGTADGIFGPKTYNAVIRFQKDHKLTVDGIIGPQTKRALGVTASSPSTVSRGGSRTITMLATAYCSCYKCNYPYYGYPSYIGLPLAKGIIAVDPNVIPMGTKLYVEGYGEGIAADQGGAIKGNHIDLCFSNHQLALDWGMQNVKVTILN
ncbi:MAG: 3D domain-containing protein [Bacillota bacterium]|nr:3D domain-containing protein [Bacillota bacterium]